MLIPELLEIYRACTLCPRACRVDRTKGELGFCRLPADIVMDCALPHHGEEPPLSGTRGAGTIFLSSCNLGCSYCQNYQISHTAKGQSLSVLEFAKVMLDLQKSGCHNVEPVTPTPQTPLIMEALCMARAQGLTVPFVCGGRGMSNKNNFKKLDDLAALLGGDVGATRPVVYAGRAGHESLVGQAGKHIKPKILFSFGISGAIQHTAGLGEADFIVAINKNPQATMMKMADVAITADASDLLNHLVRELKKRIRE